MPDDEITILKRRIAMATEQLHSLANEQRHREHGCFYAEVSSEELDEIVDILNGKDEIQ